MESNAVSQCSESLPTMLDELSRFVLVGREKLNAVRAEIRAFEVVCWTEIEQPTEFFNVDKYGDLIPR